MSWWPNDPRLFDLGCVAGKGPAPQGTELDDRRGAPWIFFHSLSEVGVQQPEPLNDASLKLALERGRDLALNLK